MFCVLWDVSVELFPSSIIDSVSLPYSSSVFNREDDKDHDMIATNKGRDRQEDHAQEGNSTCHHCSGVEDARKEVSHPTSLECHDENYYIITFAPVLGHAHAESGKLCTEPL